MDLNFCTYCDTRISHYSKSLYCSEECLKTDALKNHPLLGYEWKDFVDFPRRSCSSERKSQALRSRNISLFVENPTSSSPLGMYINNKSSNTRETTTTAHQPSFRPQEEEQQRRRQPLLTPSFLLSSLPPPLLYSSTLNPPSPCVSSPPLSATGTSTSTNSFSSHYSSALPPPSKLDIPLSSFDGMTKTDNKNINYRTKVLSSSSTNKPLKRQASFLFTSTMTMPNIS